MLHRSNNFSCAHTLGGVPHRGGIHGKTNKLPNTNEGNQQVALVSGVRINATDSVLGLQYLGRFLHRCPPGAWPPHNLHRQQESVSFCNS
jgi:hypothetical protein